MVPFLTFCKNAQKSTDGEEKGELSLTQADLGSEHSSSDTVELTLTPKSGTSDPYTKKTPYQPGAVVTVQGINIGDYRLKFSLYHGYDVALEGESDLTIKSAQVTRTAVGLDSAVSSSDGNVIVVGKPKPETDACVLEKRPVPALCEVSGPKVCTYADTVADGSTKTYTATQETCGDLTARAEIYGDLCKAGRPFDSNALVCQAK